MRRGLCVHCTSCAVYTLSFALQNSSHKTFSYILVREGLEGCASVFSKTLAQYTRGAVMSAPVYRSPAKPGGKGRAGETLPEPPCRTALLCLYTQVFFRDILYGLQKRSLCSAAGVSVSGCSAFEYVQEFLWKIMQFQWKK